MVDKAPFAGKFAIRQSVKAYAEAGLRNPNVDPKAADRLQLKKTLGYLAIMITAHAVQAKLGTESFLNHAENLQETGDVTNLGFMGIDSMYTFVNAAVTTRQVDLTGRVLKMRKNKAPKIRKKMEIYEQRQQLTEAISLDTSTAPRVAPWAEHTPRVAPWENNPIATEIEENEDTSKMEKVKEGQKNLQRKMLAAAAITLAGQGLFLASYGDSMAKNAESDCYAYANQQIIDYENIHGNVLDDAYEQQYPIDVCG